MHTVLGSVPRIKMEKEKEEKKRKLQEATTQNKQDLPATLLATCSSLNMQTPLLGHLHLTPELHAQ